eukprot:gene10803-22549_t
MGIRELLENTNIENESDFKVHIREGSCLLIDGNRWVLHIIDSCADIKFRQYGGSYDIFERKLRSEISKLTVEFMLNVKIYFDGNILKMIETRTLNGIGVAKDNEAWLNLLNYCEGSDFGCKQDCLPIFPLYFCQARATLQELNVEIITHEQKASLEIAKACALMKDDSISYYSYTNDSDFLLMKDCSCMDFDTLSKSRNDSDGCMAVTRSRKDVAANLDISESKLVELALLIGNDYTRVFPRSQLQLNIETSFRIPGDGNCSKEAIKLMLKCIQSLPEDFKLTSSNTSLQTALEYSRALYELEDISNYPEYSKRTRLISLCDEQLDSIRTYVKYRVESMNLSDDEKKTKEMKSKMDDDDVASIVIDYLYTFLQNGDGSKLSEDLHCIPLDNVQSLETMVQQLSLMEGGYRNRQYNGVYEEEGSSGAVLEMPSFISQLNDVIAAHQYQLICQEIFTCLKQIEETAEHTSVANAKPTSIQHIFKKIWNTSDNKTKPSRKPISFH